MNELTLPEVLTMAVDILLCTVVLRIIFGWLLNYPRLLRLVLVLVSLSALVAVVEYFRLPFASSYIFYVVIPVIVVTLLNYLPDLTRIYKSASRGVMFSSRVPTSPRLISELAETLHHMAERRIGAILVIGGKESIEPFVSGGESVSAKVNCSLLLSIFNTHCPRHDGAALIEGENITRIGAVLPLTSAELIDRRLGTRHLAALGMAQNCDADIFVVSEERGSISHVRESRIKDVAVSSPEVIEEALRQLLKEANPEQDKRQPRQWGAWLWLLAFIISATVSSGLTILQHEDARENARTLVSVEGKIQLINLPESLTAESIEPSAATIWLNLSDQFELAEGYAIKVDVADWVEGKEVVTLRDDMIEGLGSEASISRFEPAEVEIRLKVPKD